MGMYSPMIQTDLSFITKVSPKCLVKSVFFLHSHWAASGLLSFYMILPFCSFLAPITLTPVVGHPSGVVIFIMAMLAFSTKLPSMRSSRWLVGASGVLSTSICLLQVQLRARVPVCVVGSCLLRASVYVILVPVSVVPFSH